MWIFAAAGLFSGCGRQALLSELQAQASQSLSCGAQAPRSWASAAAAPRLWSHRLSNCGARAQLFPGL